MSKERRQQFIAIDMARRPQQQTPPTADHYYKLLIRNFTAMMYDYLNIGPSPADETCVQVGNPDYHTLARPECERFKQQIIKHYPPVYGARVAIKAFEHDFGTYLEVCVVYDIENEEANEYAFMVENDPKGVLQKWDSDTAE